jgi:hypothetical protein
MLTPAAPSIWVNRRRDNVPDSSLSVSSLMENSDFFMAYYPPRFALLSATAPRASQQLAEQLEDGIPVVEICLHPA